jgi:hypothetical protein
MNDPGTHPVPERAPAAFPLHAALAAAAAVHAAYDRVPHHFTRRVHTKIDSADLIWCAAARHLIIAIPGSNQLADWFNNLRADLAPWLLPSRVHRGFARAADDLCRQIVPVLPDITRLDFPLRVTFAGHSRGAALAALAAIHIMPFIPGQPDCQVFLFGAPRIGNRQFARFYDAARPDTWRIVNRGDIVTRALRPWLGYRHIGRFVYLSRRHSIHTAATGYPRLFLDRAFDALDHVGKPGLAALSAHAMHRYLQALLNPKP